MITAAPLLGILGTVLGIIHSFDMLGSAGIQDPQAVTSGISQALLTNHPLSESLIQRDIANVNYYFGRLGVDTFEDSKLEMWVKGESEDLS